MARTRVSFAHPLIIISSPRAGSTLLWETLKSSPELWTVGGESHFILESIPRFQASERGWESNRLTASDLDADSAELLLGRFARNLRDHQGMRYLGRPPHRRPSIVRLLEKTPRNALRVSFLDALFPDCLFLLLIRDPRESVSSIMEAWRAPGYWQFKGDLPGWDREEWCMLLPPGWRELRGRPLEEIAALQWAASYRFALDDLSRIPPHRWLVLDFADLLRDPGAELARICRFAQIRFEGPLRDLSARPLRSSSSIVTAPAAEKWRMNEEAVMRVLPSIRPLADQLWSLKQAGAS